MVHSSLRTNVEVSREFGAAQRAPHSTRLPAAGAALTAVRQHYHKTASAEDMLTRRQSHRLPEHVQTHAAFRGLRVARPLRKLLIVILVLDVAMPRFCVLMICLGAALIVFKRTRGIQQLLGTNFSRRAVRSKITGRPWSSLCSKSTRTTTLRTPT